MAEKLVLLTGATGFLGYAILLDLLKSGYRVRVAARSQAKIDKIWAAPSLSALNPSATQLMFMIVPDMIAPGAYDDAVQGVDFIIHVAAPVHSGSTLQKEQLEELFVMTSVKGSLGILDSAMKTKTVKRVVMTSSTVAIAPTEVYTKGINEHDVIRGPNTRKTVPKPPYESELQAYCAGKTAALKASEAFSKDEAVKFDLISILPSWILGRDELATSIDELRAGSNGMVIGWLLDGGQSFGVVGNAILCADAARAHVRALDSDIKGNQSFLLNTEANWKDTLGIIKKYFPDAYESGIFKQGIWYPSVPLRWDISKVQRVLGIELAGFETIIKEVAKQYIELAKESK